MESTWSGMILHLEGESGHRLSDHKHQLFMMTFGLLFQLHLVCFLLGKIKATIFLWCFFPLVCLSVLWWDRMSFERVWICNMGLILCSCLWVYLWVPGKQICATIPGFLWGKNACLRQAFTQWDWASKGTF